MEKIKSIVKKGKTVLKEGLNPYDEGKYNFYNSTPEIEQLTKDRLEVCKGCVHFKKDANSLFHIGGMFGAKNKDNYPELNNKSCEECGCIMSFKIRQTKSICKKWQR